MSVEDLIKLYKDYLNCKSVMEEPSLKGFMEYLESCYWLEKPILPKPKKRSTK